MYLKGTDGYKYVFGIVFSIALILLIAFLAYKVKQSRKLDYVSVNPEYMSAGLGIV